MLPLCCLSPAIGQPSVKLAEGVVSGEDSANIKLF
jgi:hypothetical protein